MWAADKFTMFVTAFATKPFHEKASQVVINLFFEKQLHCYLITKDSRALIRIRIHTEQL